MMYLILGVALTLGSLANAAPKKAESKALTIGSYRIRETTRLYPLPNYYNQMLDCSELGGLNPFQALPTAPTINPGNNAPGVNFPGLGNIGNNGSVGTGNDIGGLIGNGGNAGPVNTGNSGTGVISIDPVGNNGTGTSTGGVTGIPLPTPNLDPVGGLTLDRIVNIGNVIWAIVDMGRASASVQSYRAHALPKGIACWTDLENWQIPVSKVFTVEYKNKLGQVVAVYTYRISYVYGGNVNGVGKYIANLTVTPVDLRVGWGFSFSSQVQIPATFNIGTKQNPVAGMQVFVFWSIGNALKVEQRSSLFFVAGDGRIQLTESK